MQNLNVTGMDWRERTLISQLYVNQCVKLKLDQRETRSLKMDGELENDAICLRFYFTYKRIPFQGIS